ncbi:IucA/IucC family siderophore biosynthesis protein [Actinospica durhamensis]|uniref:IucA/IucC family siderophore biosynthesis protein n=1 Tax=Actinospica durhamensis TaxID=1508375 RepID=A0A941EPH1_9ACTN|nr:IucA/IucC family siderophore biosynthesis protein [Actinospica durhamensis]MBR7834771.1 IucA/IucC family siderophore biosynthesis protein [Actinospica durhamensis]
MTPPPRPRTAVEADPALLRRAAGRTLLAKTLGEFAYEELITPVPVPGETGWYRLSVTAAPCDAPAPAPAPAPVSAEAVDAAALAAQPASTEYAFRARRGAYGSWFVEAGSLRREGHPAADPLTFLADAQGTLGLSGDTAGHLVREFAATLAADVRIAAGAGHSAKELAGLGYAELEGCQTGHPWIAFNKGRLGFSVSDTELYAPESRVPGRLMWIAVRDDVADYRAVPGLTARRLYTEELSPAERVRFGAELIRRGCNPARYWWLPVHPWQWDEMIQVLFGTELADARMVFLGEGDDVYLPQQSIRTFSNISQPARRHVKLPLSILNTMVWRGLPTDRTLAAPAVTAWLQGLAAADGFLSGECRVILLGEIASVTVRHEVLDRMPGVPYQYRELLGAIWREPLPPALEPGERARTLASLLSVGADGRPLVAELVARSGRSAPEWLALLLHAVLPPLLHFLYVYGTAFSPHGENAVVVFDEDESPVRLAVKDFVDDVNIAAVDLPELAGLSQDAARVLLREEPGYLCQFLHGALFVGHFRYLADLFEQRLGVPTERFWAAVRVELAAYQARFPERAERYRLFDLATPQIERLCLNRNRLLLNGYRDLSTRPHVEPYGTVLNPLAG